MKVIFASARIDKSEIFNAYDHHTAFFLAMDKGIVTEDDFLGPRHEEGFVNDAGEWMTREEAYQLGVANNQVDLKEANKLFNEGEVPWLEAGCVFGF
jgi:hypothetical protein